MNKRLTLLVKQAVGRNHILKMYFGSGREICKVCSEGDIMQFKRQTELEIQFQRGSIYLLIEGVIAYISKEGKIIHFSEPGNTICPHLLDVKILAVTSCKVLELSCDCLRTHIANCGDLIHQIQQDNIRLMNEIIHFHILDTNDKFLKLASQHRLLYKRLSGRLISKYIGVSQQTVSRMRKDLE